MTGVALECLRVDVGASLVPDVGASAGQVRPPGMVSVRTSQRQGSTASRTACLSRTAAKRWGRERFRRGRRRARNGGCTSFGVRLIAPHETKQPYKNATGIGLYDYSVKGSKANFWVVDNG